MSSPHENTKRTIASLTPKQQHVLGCIAINQDVGHPRETLKALERRGLIVGTRVPVGGALFVTRYHVPMPVHMAWCEWCAEVDA